VLDLPGLLHRVEARLASTQDAHAEQLHELRRSRDAACRELSVWTTMSALALASVPEDTLVSVVLPTHNRASILPRALASVAAQEYGHWELLVVDDDSDDGTAALLAGQTDPRIRALRSERHNVCAARNVALLAASGAVIAYLDDDNVMHPRWLKSVVWAFREHPTVDVLYGAHVHDDVERTHGRGRGGLPWLQFDPYDRAALERHNLTDIGAIAHRYGVPGAWFDEQLVQYGDWDLLLRLTTGRPPFELPAVACLYTTDVGRRLSQTHTDGDDFATVRSKLGDLVLP
jgi:glycosyltransferase involved in cell wall biosynthesis